MLEKGKLRRRIASVQSSIDEELGEVQENKVKRGLKQRHVSMIALGGTIGTGLFIGTGSALKNAGPAGALIGYIFIATVVYSLAMSVGEMAAYIPITGSFSVFCTRFVSPAFGASIGWMYWFTWAIASAVELAIVGNVIEFWTDKVPISAWIAISFVLITALNLFSVGVYGEIEFWSASIKVVAVVGWLIYALCMVCGATNKLGAVGFRYWRNPGAFGPGILVDNMSTARFLGWLSALINAAFTYSGCELVGVSAGESANPRKTVPRAINRVFFRILIFYIGSIFFMGLLVPYNDKALSSDNSYISSSPFVIAILNSGTPVLPHIFNAVILTTILSTANANIYVGSRLLYALGVSGTAPRFFTWTSKYGVPYLGVIFTSMIGLLGFLSVSATASVAFEWLVNLSTVACLLAWIGIGVSHLRFMDALEYHGISRDDLPFKAVGGRAYVWYALICVIVITIIQGFTSFWNFTASNFLTAYISMFVWIILWLFFQFVFYRGKIYKDVKDIDIFTGSQGPGVELEEEKEMSKWEKFLDWLF